MTILSERPAQARPAAAGLTPGRTGQRRTGHRRPVTARPWTRDLTGAALWLLLLWVTALWVSDHGVGDLTTVSGALTSTGRITGLISSALLLVQVFLMARVPVIEQAWGQDALTRGHRVIGFTSFTLMLAHLVLIWLGYAAGSALGLWGTLWDLVVNSPGMILAVAGTAALVMVVLTSLRATRARLRYESWHLIHLYGYLGAGLALPHQLWTGSSFLNSTASTVTWWGLYAVAAGSVILWRVALPLWRSLRAPIRVLSVRQDAPNITTVTVGGAGVSRLTVRSGQFFQWRFLDGPGWTRAHPISLSAAPDGRTLRMTAAVVGDGTARLAALTPGTRALIEGPYGRLHAGVRSRRKVLLMGSGIGITPLRALLEDLPADPGDLTVIHRVHDRHTAVLGDEMANLARQRGATHLVIDGPRARGRASWLPTQAEHLSDAEALRQLVPTIAEHDVYLCGSPGWVTAARSAALACGVPAAHIHDERFSL